MSQGKRELRHLPIFLEVAGRRCVMVGGGEVALRKVDRCLRAQAMVEVIAPELCNGLAGLLAEGAISHSARHYRRGDLTGAVLAYAATDDRETNQAVYAEARSLGIPVNVVDCPELCSFITPSIIERPPIQVAVSSSGASPVLARLLRARMETLIPAAYGELARLMAGARAAVTRAFPEPTLRRRFWERVLQGPVAELLFSGRAVEATLRLQAEIGAGPASPLPRGEVYLVGAGPGDPDLLTFRALRLMQQADTVVYDRLVAAPLLDLVRRDAERIYVGKARDQHTLPQEEINQLLVRLARQGQRVLRLKGGDPFIFGRGGEEIATLKAEGIPFQVVPGVTAASGCAAYAGIPLTHRDHAQAVVFVTGHMQNGRLDLDWKALASGRTTRVFYMGVQALPLISQGLLDAGLAPDTPAALIERGTLKDQRVIVGTLLNLPARVAGANVKPPSLIVVGSVVSLHDSLAWFDGYAALHELPGDPITPWLQNPEPPS
jgi:uroporphyrin-III C-methyltransferase / precorrin-2 dehydrogenase / sirohydrochlorin ferrochelatase